MKKTIKDSWQEETSVRNKIITLVKELWQHHRVEESMLQLESNLHLKHPKSFKFLGNYTYFLKNKK